MRKIEKINADKFEDLGTWVNALTDKVNELVDSHNQFIKKQVIQANEITTTVANISTLKYSADKIDCNFKASIDTLSVNDEVL